VFKLYAVWTTPEREIEAYEKHYVEIHAPLAAAIPGLEKLVLTHTGETLGEEPSPFHRLAELWFADKAAFEAAAESPELAAAAQDAQEMQERFGTTLHSPAGESVDSPLGPFVPPPGYEPPAAA
jgi:uncharacterized protein (TIGR02118 family)